MKKFAFTKGVERLVDPMSVGTMHFIQPLNSLLPKTIQKRLITAASKKNPVMGFVVEPYSFYLFYEIADLAKAEAILPDGFRLIKTSIFEHDEPKYYCISSCFRAHTSAFWGVRNELYLIAEDESTGLLSWIIMDYDTDTISYDNQSGLRAPDATKAVCTIDYSGTIIADIGRSNTSHSIAFTAKVDNGTMTPLNQRLWLEGNLSIGYGRTLSQNQADIFSLKFDPSEVEQALNVPLTDVHITTNSWYPGLFEQTPAHAVCFPYAQHFVSDSPGYTSQLKNKQDLLEADEAIDFDKAGNFSPPPFQRMLIINSIVSTAIIVLLIVLLIIK